MQTFYYKDEYTKDDIISLIENEVEESIHLEFKESQALGRSENKRKELSKDVASFANSDGGIIIYGIQEINHRAKSLSFINGNDFTKEWIEQVINSNIQRHIPDLKIFPIRFDSKIENTIYLIKIPKSSDAPHISRDKRFYKRFNFESVMMEEYEIRQLYARKSKSKLEIGEYVIAIENKEEDDDKLKIRIEVSVINSGDVPESSYKLNLYFNNIDKHTAITWDRTEGDYDITRYEINRVKLSTQKHPTIYPMEKVDLIRVKLEIPTPYLIESLETIDFELKLFYSNGEDELKRNFKKILNKLKSENGIQQKI